jgi:hypothetical protein
MEGTSNIQARSITVRIEDYRIGSLKGLYLLLENVWYLPVSEMYLLHKRKNEVHSKERVRGFDGSAKPQNRSLLVQRQVKQERAGRQKKPEKKKSASLEAWRWGRVEDWESLHLSAPLCSSLWVT